MPGKLAHFELPAQDVGRAKGFWSGVFGWSFTDPGMPEIEYWMAQTAEGQGAAIFRAEESKGGPIVYFDTDSIDASIAKVRELGGKAEEKVPIPHIGWFARCTDTEGNDFSLFQSDETAS